MRKLLLSVAIVTACVSFFLSGYYLKEAELPSLLAEQKVESEIDGCLKTLYVFELSTVIHQQEDRTKIEFCRQTTKTFTVTR